MKTRLARDAEGSVYLWFWCPGCDQPHAPRVDGPDVPTPPARRPKWTWNQDRERPTLAPSILVHISDTEKCHSFVRDGEIQFLGDSYHQLSGQTVPLPDWPKPDWAGLTDE